MGSKLSSKLSKSSKKLPAQAQGIEYAPLENKNNMTTKKKPSTILDKSTANRTRPTNGIDSTLNDTNLPFTPEPAARYLAFTAPRAQNREEIPEVNIETSSLGLSPSMEDIKSNKNEQDSQFERESRG